MHAEEPGKEKVPDEFISKGFKQRYMLAGVPEDCSHRPARAFPLPRRRRSVHGGLRTVYGRTDTRPPELLQALQQGRTPMAAWSDWHGQGFNRGIVNCNLALDKSSLSRNFEIDIQIIHQFFDEGLLLLYSEAILLLLPTSKL